MPTRGGCGARRCLGIPRPSLPPLDRGLGTNGAGQALQLLLPNPPPLLEILFLPELKAPQLLPPTLYASRMPSKTLMEYMGISKFNVVWRYMNFTRAEKVAQFERATRSILGSGRAWQGEAGEGYAMAIIEGLRGLLSGKPIRSHELVLQLGQPYDEDSRMMSTD